MKLYCSLCVLVFGFVFFTPDKASACSVCRCGDNTFQFADQTLPLADKDVTGRFRLTIANAYSSKSNALEADGETGSEHQKENRPSFRAMLRPTSEFAFTAELPVSMKHLTERIADDVEHSNSSGIGDAELGVQWTHALGKSCPSPYAIGFSAMVKLPTGQNDLSKNSERIEDHLQPGTGTTDGMLGMALSRSSRTLRLFASAYYRLNGTNNHEFTYGNAVLLNIGAQTMIAKELIGSLQVNARHAKWDVEKGETDENSGGSIAYLTPGMRIGILHELSLSASVQIPVWNNLNGDQTENAVIQTGVSLDL